MFDGLANFNVQSAAASVGKAAAEELRSQVGGLGTGLAGGAAQKLLDVVDGICSDVWGIDFPNGEQSIAFVKLAADGWGNLLVNAAKDVARSDGYAGGETLRDVLGPWAMQAGWPGASQVALARGWFWAINAIRGGSVGKDGLNLWSKRLADLQAGKSVEYYWPPAAKGAQKLIAHPGETGGKPVPAGPEQPDPLLIGAVALWQAEQDKKKAAIAPLVAVAGTQEGARALAELSGVQTENDKTMMVLGAIALGIAIAKG